MIALREGEFVVSAYVNEYNLCHYAMTNFGILWVYHVRMGKWIKAFK